MLRNDTISYTPLVNKDRSLNTRYVGIILRDKTIKSDDIIFAGPEEWINYINKKSVDKLDFKDPIGDEYVENYEQYPEDYMIEKK